MNSFKYKVLSLLDSRFHWILNLFFYCKYLKYDKSILNNNKKLIEIRKNERAFILATGPSIKKENLKLLAGEDCFSVSNFYLHEDLNIINPKLHFFAPYHEPLILENYVDWLRQADKQLPVNTKIVLGHSTQSIVKENNLFPNREVFYIYLSPTNSNNINITKRIKSPQTGPIMIIPVLIYMGYKEIYLLGCDHNVLKDYRNEVKNFYEPKCDIRKNATDKTGWLDIISEIKSTLNVFLQYDKYRLIARKYKVDIYNLSNDSWLEVFVRGDLNDVLQK